MELEDFLNSWKKPDWDRYFMAYALLASVRSPDPATKHGCVIVDPKSHRILSTGYNGYPAGCKDELMPKTRPDKYLVTPHAEDNAISGAARHGVKIEGSTFYVTGRPCTPCFTKILQAGGREIVYGDVGSHCVGDKDLEMQKLLTYGRDDFNIRKIKGNSFLDIFKWVEEYYRLKSGI